jgi:hypothetical protein
MSNISLDGRSFSVSSIILVDFLWFSTDIYIDTKQTPRDQCMVSMEGKG